MLALVASALCGCGQGLERRTLAECRAHLDEARAALKSDSSAELNSGLWSTNQALLALNRNRSHVDDDKWSEMQRETRLVRRALGRKKAAADARGRVKTARETGDTERLLRAVKAAMKTPGVPKSQFDMWAAEMKPLQEKADFAEISRLLKADKRTEALEKLTVFVKVYPKNRKARLIKEGLEEAKARSRREDP